VRRGAARPAASGEARSHTLERRAAAAEEGERVVDALRRWLSEVLGESVPMARVRALVLGGAARVNGQVARGPGRPLRRGDQVVARIEPGLLKARATRTDQPFALSDERVLLDDGVVLAVDKPPGLPTHATADPSRPSLVAHVARRLRSRGVSTPPSVHQRLDRDTSGVVLFGVASAANAGLHRAFAEHAVAKTYLALTAARPGEAARRFRVAAPLGPARGGRGGVRVGGEGARPAETEVDVVEVLGPACLVEARPLTGRKHQVRAHLAHAGLPILGDALYGAPLRPAVPRIMLHASRLALRHPTTGMPLVLEAPLPADFESALRELRRAGPKR
jgi:RluA family pseudouridine synthase